MHLSYTITRHLLLADTQSMRRRGMRSVLNEQLNHLDITEATDNSVLLEKLARCKTDLLVLDAQLPGLDAVRFLKAAAATYPGTYILIHSDEPEMLTGPLYLEAGARGYLQNGCSEEELVRAVKSVGNGNFYVSPALQTFYLRNKDTDHPYSRLTQKELEVLQHIAAGLSTTKISEIMQVSKTTISSYKAKLKVKLDVNSLFDALSWHRRHQ